MIVAALVDEGTDGRWAADLSGEAHLLAPHLMPVEVANVLRRAVRSGEIGEDVASLAHADLVELPVTFVEYAPLARRIWELRSTVSAYDAWYVAVAEAWDVDLATLDARLARAPGPRCRFRLPAK